MNLPDLIQRHIERASREDTKRGAPPRPATQKARWLQLDRFEQYCRAHQIIKGADLTVNMLKDWILSIPITSGPSNRNQAIAILSGFVAWLADDRTFSRDDADSWSNWAKQHYRKWRHRGPDLKFLRPEQLESLLLSMADETPNPTQSARDLSFFGLILFGPSRLGEVRMQDMEHVEYYAATDTFPDFYRFTVPEHIAKDHEKHILYLFSDSSRIGTVDIYDQFHRYYAWRQELGPTGPLFVSIRSHRRGKRGSATNWHKVLATAAGRAKLNLTSHYLRHTFGEMAAPQLDKRDLRQIFGHSADQTTEGYTDHDNPDRLIAAHHRAAQAITQSTGN